MSNLKQNFIQIKVLCLNYTELHFVSFVMITTLTRVVNTLIRYHPFYSSSQMLIFEDLLHPLVRKLFLHLKEAIRHLKS